MSTKNRKVFVSGADGFIGSHLVEELVRQGYDVSALVLYNSQNSWGWLDGVSKEIKDSLNVISGDIRDPYSMRNAISGNDAVLHLAALVAIPYSYVAPESYVATNVGGTLNVLQAARAVGVQRFIHTSTSEVYGTARFVPITEDHPLQPQSPYSASKIGSDCLALSFQKSFDMPVAIIRPFNTYGPRQSARAVIPTIITQLASGKRQVKLGSTHPTRDFSFVRDTVAGFIAMLQCDTAAGAVVNLGSNFEVSIGEAASIIAEVMGQDIEIVEESHRRRPESSEVERLWSDNSQAEKLLSWRPQYSGLEGFRRGIGETVEWFSNSDNLSMYKSDSYLF